MEERFVKMLELMVDRCQTQVCSDDICYVEVKDKLCTIHKKNREEIQIFMSISKLEEQLPRDAFVRISRCYLVSYDCIEKIQKEIVLIDGKSLQYSARKKSQIMKSYYQYLSKEWDTHRNSNNEGKESFQREICKKYETMIDFPVAVIVLKAKVISQSQKMCFELIFGNFQAARLLELPYEEVTGKNLTELLFENENPAWIRFLAQTAFHGKKERREENSTKLHKNICIEAYQLMYGYCTCLLWDVTKKA